MTTDATLKLRLAAMLPEVTYNDSFDRLRWRSTEVGPWAGALVRDTELDYLVRLAEAKLTEEQKREYAIRLRNNTGLIWGFPNISATWQQRVLALCQTRGI